MQARQAVTGIHAGRHTYRHAGRHMQVCSHRHSCRRSCRHRHAGTGMQAFMQAQACRRSCRHRHAGVHAGDLESYSPPPSIPLLPSLQIRTLSRSPPSCTSRPCCTTRPLLRGTGSSRATTTSSAARSLRACTMRAWGSSTRPGGCWECPAPSPRPLSRCAPCSRCCSGTG